MADPRIPATELGEVRELIRDILRRLNELEKPTGTQLSKAVEKILSLLDTLADTVQAYISTYSYTKTQIDSKTWSTSAITTGVLPPARGGTGTDNVYNNPLVSGTALQVYVTSDGVLNRGASSERFKQDIETWLVDLGALLSLTPRTFRWITEVETADDPDGVPADFGLIAEEVEAAGLDWLVRLGEDGRPEGVHYHRLPIALLALAQHQQQIIIQYGVELASLAGRVTALEEKDTA